MGFLLNMIWFFKGILTFFFLIRFCFNKATTCGLFLGSYIMTKSRTKDLGDGFLFLQNCRTKQIHLQYF